MLIAGSFSMVNGSARNYVARLNADGSLDPNFDPGVGPNSGVYSLARQSDGKILLGGWFTSISGVPRNRVARLNADGSLDPSFNPGAGVGDSFVAAVAVQPDGRIIIAGAFASVNGESRNGIARLNADGTLDTDFNPGTGADFGINAVALDASNRILVGGYFGQFNGILRNGVARLNPNGSLDSSFVPGIAAYPAIEALALQPDGKLLVAGYSVAFGGVIRRLARLNTNGSVDSSFNPGSGFTGPPGSYSTTVRALAVQADGKILAGGNFTDANGIQADRLARLNTNGTVDVNFDPGSIGGPVDGTCVCLKLQEDGKILLSGDFQKINGISRQGIARLNAGDSQSAGRLEFNSSFVQVGESDGTVTLTVVRRRSTNGTATVNYATGNGSAVAGEDYLATSGTLTFAPGVTTQNFKVTILNDSLVENSEGFSVMLSSPGGGARLGIQDSINVAITDDDTTVAFSAPVYTVSENQTNAVITVERQGIFLGAMTVAYATSNGTAIAGSDYTAVSGTLAFAAGEQSKTFGVPILPDLVDEPNEALQLSLSNPSAPVTLGSNATAVLVIAEVGVLDTSFNPGTGPDSRVESLAIYPGGKILIQGSFIQHVNGTPRPGLARLNTDGSLDMGFLPALNDSATAMAVGADGLVYVRSGIGLGTHISRLLPDGSRDDSFVASYSTDDVPLGVQADGKLLINRSSQSLNFNVVTNRLLRLNRDGAVDANFTQEAWIENRLTWRPGISVLKIQPDGKLLVGGRFTHAAGIARNGLARFHTDGSLDMEFNANLEGWIVSCLDLLPDGRILIAGSFTSVNGMARTHLARLNADGTLDADFAFAIDPASSVYAVLALPEGKAIVTGDFLGTNPRLFLGNVLRLNADGSIDPEFFATAGCCASSMALQGDGKLLLAGSFTGLQGISRPYLARLKGSPGSGAGTIEFNSPTLTITEQNRELDVTLRRSGGSNGVILVRYATMDGTATAGTDYAPQTGVITFADGDNAEKMITIPILDDSIAEGDESFSVSMSNPIGGAAWGQAAATTVTILDSDTAVQFAANRWRIRESAGAFLINVQRLGRLAGTVSVDYTTSDGTAQASLDYLAQSSTLTFTDGETNKLIVAPILDDRLNEGDETIELTLSHPTSGVMLGTNFTTELVIVDNDHPGTVDDSFNPGTGVCDDPNYGEVYTVVSQADGRILVGGSFSSFNGVPCRGIVRLLPDGSVDPGFVASLPVSGQLPLVTRMALQSDGKVLLVAALDSFYNDNFLARLNPNGSFDSSFEFALAQASGGFSPGQIEALLLQSDGRIVIGGGFDTIKGVARTNLARLNADGSLDAALATLVTTSFGTGYITALANAGDGKLIIAGLFEEVDGVSCHNLARLGTNGLLDAAFDASGLTNAAGDEAEVWLRTIAVQTDGKVLVGGTRSQFDGQILPFLARLNANGGLDTNFSTIVSNDIFGATPSVSVILRQPDHKLLIAGHFTSVNGIYRRNLARLDPDGSLDASFQSGEEAPNPYFDYWSDDVRALALQADGQVIIGGKFSDMDDHALCGVARLNGVRLNLGGIARDADGRSRIWFSGTAGASYIVLASSDLIHWTTIGAAVETATDAFEFCDPDSTNQACRFYRLKLANDE
jgi:uncharacterized delta-60 repeat protein